MTDDNKFTQINTILSSYDYVDGHISELEIQSPWDNLCRHIAKEINKINSRSFKLETDNFHEIKEEFVQCSFFIGVDSGLTHICAGLGLSGIFLFGPTDPSKVGPVFDHQRVIKRSEMTEINPSLIIEMLKEESFE